MVHFYGYRVIFEVDVDGKRVNLSSTLSINLATGKVQMDTYKALDLIYTAQEERECLRSKWVPGPAIGSWVITDKAQAELKAEIAKAPYFPREEDGMRTSPEPGFSLNWLRKLFGRPPANLKGYEKLP